MHARQFDQISRSLADGRLSRRLALSAGLLSMAGMRSASAEDDSTPPAESSAEKTTYMFVQSFRSGSIAQKEGSDDTYTVTLEGGTGQTIYFADRPSRDVGVVPSGDFLDGLGFSPDNPPNAALVVETAPGETDVAVVELFNPVVTSDGSGVTYDIQVLANWQDSLELGFSEAPTDLAAIEPSFGPAHLFIDDCADDYVTCYNTETGSLVGRSESMGMCWNFALCIPCEPYGHVQPDRCSTRYYWDEWCNKQFSHDCRSACKVDDFVFTYLCP
jgi:hypothetical protein